MKKNTIKWRMQVILMVMDMLAKELRTFYLNVILHNDNVTA